MDNYYEENPALSIDPCHDNFIRGMEALGYTLTADVILPKGFQIRGHWYASCWYLSEQTRVLIDSSTAPFMEPDETLAPRNDTKAWSRLVDIGGREGIARPSVSGGTGCMVSMRTSFGSITANGGDRNRPDENADCTRIIDLLHQIEPWIND